MRKTRQARIAGRRTAGRSRAPTALLVLADGTVLEGFGFGADGEAAGEVCFNTAMTGYQEILTDPSYAGQIITFTFPHIGNVGTNEEDIETVNMAASLRRARRRPRAPRSPSRPTGAPPRHLDAWLKARGIVGLAGVDTRALTALIREKGMPNGVIAHDPAGDFDLDALKSTGARAARHGRPRPRPEVTCAQRYAWDETDVEARRRLRPAATSRSHHVVALDYGVKRNILRLLAERRLPGHRRAGDRDRRGGPGAAARRRLPVQRPRRPGGDRRIRGAGDPRADRRRRADLRHLPRPPDAGLAVGGKTHEDASGPPRREPSGEGPHHRQGRDRLDEPRLRGRLGEPAAQREETHVSLFDGSNCGIALTDRPAFSVQYHPEASPGPRDSHYLFDRFVEMMAASKSKRSAA